MRHAGGNVDATSHGIRFISGDGTVSVDSGLSQTFRTRSFLTGVRIIVFCAIGVAVNLTPVFLATFSVLLEPIEASLEESRTAIMAGYAACTIALAIAGPFVGRLVDKYGQGRVIFAGILLQAMALSSFYLLPASLPLFVLQCGVVGLVGSATYQFVYFSVVSLWFDKGLGLALAFAGVGTSIGFLIFLPLTHHFVSTYDWQTTYLVLALISAAIALPNLLLYRRPAASPVLASGPPQHHVHGVTATEAFRMPAFWKLALSFFLMCLMLNGNLLHFVAIMTARGVDAGAAAQMAGVAGVGVLAGRLGSGFLLMRFNGAYVGGLIFMFGVVGAAILTRASDPVSITCGILLLSLTLGSEGELLNFMAHRAFGIRAQGTILGCLTAVFLMGILAGPLMMSIWFDLTGSYGAGQIVLVIAGFLAALLHLSVAGAVRRTKAAPLEGTQQEVTS